MLNYIGVVDLTVRLSSMNPLGHKDSSEAGKTLERCVIAACADVLAVARRATPPRDETLRSRGIVVQGPAAKFFHFEHADDLVKFVTSVRWSLIEERLPFKLCVSSGELVGDTLRHRLRTQLELVARPEQTEEREHAADELLRELGTDDPKYIEPLLDVYRAPGGDDDAVRLMADMERFKGFGIHVASGTALGEASARLAFINHTPGRTAGRGSPADYLDLRLPSSPEDVIRRFRRDAGDATGRGEETLFPIGGLGATISGLLDLLRRSFKADEASGAYYVSMLTTLVRSSPFGTMRKLTKPEVEADESAGDDRTLDRGWQRHPPIFHTLILDTRNRPMFRRIDGIELVLGALVDEVHAAAFGGPRSSDISPRPSEPSDGSRPPTEAGSLFASAVQAIAAAYGEPQIRRVLRVPATVLGQAGKRALLGVLADG